MSSFASWFNQTFIGDLNSPVDIYCERTTTAWNAEPLNALSNLAFFIAAYFAWRLQKQRPNLNLHKPIGALCIIIAVVGAGSLTFHTVATKWAEWADVIPILVFMIVYCWLILTVFFRLGFVVKILLTLVFFLATFYLEADQFEKILWGGAMYLPTLAFLMGAGVGIWRKDPEAGKAFFVAAGLFALSFTARTIDKPLCGVLPIGTHYFWHIFNATVLFLLVRTLILHAPGAEAVTGKASRGAAVGASRS